jgi:hypothetical protein
VGLLFATNSSPRKEEAASIINHPLLDTVKFSSALKN